MKVFLKNYSSYFIFGAVGASAFQPFGIFVAFFLSFGWLFSRIRLEKSRRILYGGSFLFFMSFYLSNLYWMAVPLTIDFEHHGFLIPIAICLIPAYLSLMTFPAVIVSAGVKNIRRCLSMFCAVFGISFYFYGHFCPGFPWTLPGYIWNFHEIFMQSLSIVGIYGLSLITIFMACLCGTAFVFFKEGNARGLKISGIIFFSVFAFLFLFGFFRLQKNPVSFTNYGIRVIQGNLSQHGRDESNVAFDNLKSYVEESKTDAAIDFIIWPECTVKYIYEKNDEALNSWLKLPLKKGGYLITGAPRRDLETGKVFNSLIVINYSGENIESYDKIRLVPFGEYIPFREYLPFKNVTNEMGDFDRGTDKKILTIKGLKIAPMICYEAVFPTECVKDSLFGLGAKSFDADVIINLTNDAWFGFTSEPFQHLQIVRARAIELGVPLIRSVNFGVSAVFDSFGRIIAAVPFNQKGVISSHIPERIKDSTLYEKYGDLFFGFMLLFLFILRMI